MKLVLIACLLALFAPAVAAGTADSLGTADVWQLSEAHQHYLDFTSVWRPIHIAVNLAVPLVLFFTGWSAGLWRRTERMRQPFVRMVAYVFLLGAAYYALKLPFAFYRGWIVEQNYGFSRQDAIGWFFDFGLWALIMTALTGVVVFFLYRLVARPRWWWFRAWLIAVPLMLAAVFVAPLVLDPLFADFEPLTQQPLRNNIVALAREHGVENPDVLLVDTSERSTRINAYVTGLAGSARIVLYDNLIEKFEPDEVMFVVAHELGHYVHDHVTEGTLAYIVFVLAAFWLASRILPRLIHIWGKRLGVRELSDPSALPLAIFFVLALGLLSGPLVNGYSRWIENRADRFALAEPGLSFDTVERTYRKLAAYNFSDPAPHPLVEYWFYTHPSLSSRIEDARLHLAP